MIEITVDVWEYKVDTPLVCGCGGGGLLEGKGFPNLGGALSCFFP